jgi:DNA-binding NarL/FixJ family response regulator
MNPTFKVLVADDHAMLRRGLRSILEAEFPGVEIGEAASCEGALQLIWKSKWDLLILDLIMPGRSGLDLLDECRKRHSEMPVLVLSSTPEDEIAVGALRAGATGYLCKLAAAKQLATAVRRLKAGGRYISPTLAERLASEIGRNGEEPPHARLSSREFEVFRRMASGECLKSIASNLSLSTKTVSTFRGRVFSKLGVESDLELMLYANHHKLFNA